MGRVEFTFSDVQQLTLQKYITPAVKNLGLATAVLMRAIKRELRLMVVSDELHIWLFSTDELGVSMVGEGQYCLRGQWRRKLTFAEAAAVIQSKLLCMMMGSEGCGECVKLTAWKFGQKPRTDAVAAEMNNETTLVPLARLVPLRKYCGAPLVGGPFSDVYASEVYNALARLHPSVPFSTVRDAVDDCHPGEVLRVDVGSRLYTFSVVVCKALYCLQAHCEMDEDEDGAKDEDKDGDVYSVATPVHM